MTVWVYSCQSPSPLSEGHHDIRVGIWQSGSIHASRHRLCPKATMILGWVYGSLGLFIPILSCGRQECFQEATASPLLYPSGGQLCCCRGHSGQSTASSAKQRWQVKNRVRLNIHYLFDITLFLCNIVSFKWPPLECGRRLSFHPCLFIAQNIRTVARYCTELCTVGLLA